jgi:hypothetical protein
MGELRSALLQRYEAWGRSTATPNDNPVEVQSLAEKLELASRFQQPVLVETELPPLAVSVRDALALAGPDYAAAFDLMVTRMCLFSPGQVPPGSGALLDDFGVLYVSPSDDWVTEDVAECLVHELTHTCLWLDEFRFGHHPDPQMTGAIEHFGTTSITGMSKSATVVFHSFITAVEVLELRTRLGRTDGCHGPTGVVTERATTAYVELQARPDLTKHFTPRALELMAKSYEVINTTRALTV